MSRLQIRQTAKTYTLSRLSVFRFVRPLRVFIRKIEEKKSRSF